MTQTATTPTVLIAEPGDPNCHLRDQDAGVLCGASAPRKHSGSADDRPWRGGESRCPACGGPLCPACLQIAETYERTGCWEGP